MKRVDALVSHKNVIEMNGRQYDARTGRILQGDIIVPNTPKRQGSVDGFVKPQPTLIQPVITNSTPAPHSRPRRNSSVAVNHKRRNPQRSQILMRNVVHKPSGHTTKTAAISSVNKIVNSGERSMRAQSTAKSPFIHRYHSNPTQSHITKKTEHLAVAEPPTEQPGHHTAKAEPVKQSHHSHNNKRHTKQTSSQDLFNSALEKAKVPSKPVHAKHNRSKAAKRSSLAGSLLAGFLLIGFIAYLNWPNLNMRLASSQAGFNAELPDYQPAGYSFTGPVSFEAGKVTINFQSNTDERAYKLQQEVSSWNSQSLVDNFLAAHNKTYDVQQEGGRTIYLYEQGKATWVNGGIWYQIDGQNLSPDQLVKIASSL